MRRIRTFSKFFVKQRFLKKNNLFLQILEKIYLQISKVHLVKDQNNPEKTKGYGYVEFETRDDLIIALQMTKVVKLFVRILLFGKSNGRELGAFDSYYRGGARNLSEAGRGTEAIVKNSLFKKMLKWKYSVAYRIDEKAS